MRDYIDIVIVSTSEGYLNGMYEIIRQKLSTESSKYTVTKCEHGLVIDTCCGLIAIRGYLSDGTGITIPGVRPDFYICDSTDIDAVILRYRAEANNGIKLDHVGQIIKIINLWTEVKS